MERTWSSPSMVVNSSVEDSIPANATGYSESERVSVEVPWPDETSLTTTVNVC